MERRPQPWNLDRPNRGHLLLVGYRGSGKTTVGRKLAHHWKRPFHDSDDWITQQSGRSIAEGFAMHGETAFRNQEQEAFAHLIAESPGVLSVGGGAIERLENRKLLQGAGVVIWLQASPEVLWQRIQSDPETKHSRPALTKLSGLDEVRTVLQRRAPFYEEIADMRFDTDDLTIDEVVQRIIDRLPS